MLCTPVVYWLERCPFKAEKRDRNPFGVPFIKHTVTAETTAATGIYLGHDGKNDSVFNKCLG